jgi:hypothetical protein
MCDTFVAMPDVTAGGRVLVGKTATGWPASRDR